MTQTLLEINIKVQYIRYTSEHIPKLQLHQHSLLTRKVFSWHNLLAQVFFSVSSGSSSGLRHLQVIFIFNSSSSISHLHLDLDHHLIWIIITESRSSLDLDHDHWIWIIITESRSSLDLDHHHWIWIIITGSGSSLDLDHISWINIIGYGSSLDLDHHHWI